MRRRQFLGATLSTTAALALQSPQSEALTEAELPAEITRMSASTLSAAIHQRLVGCGEVMEAYLARIHHYNPVYNAIVSMRPDDESRALARAADDALDRGEYWGWMHGMPHAVKDESDVEGFPTSSGSPVFAGTMAHSDGFMVRRIRAQGAIFIGKTNLPEFGMGSQTYNPVFGTTGSAWNPALTAGGSSGGTACGLVGRSANSVT